ncbi:MAG: MFS transporter [Bauldia sp.]|uniref:MDR family MFS transporter n=1 Tax=Bauldia sp. TaxID=2575872 RepID=UPI001DB7C799|nr:MDR family MFS transporter [Bauldia sp.]MCB1494799.1 MFS transporter [Bauldia sp.]
MTSPAAPAGAPIGHAEIRTILIGVVLAMLLGALDQTIVVTALPTIGRDLGNAESLSWVVTAYLVTSTSVTPLYGKLSDIHGRRVTLMAAISIFLVGSVACALSPSIYWLIGARAFQGLGGGALISLGQTIIGDVVAPRERGRYQAYFAAVFTTSSIAGPVLGGLFAEYLHWSLIFWINLPLGVAAYVMTSRVLRLLPRHEHPHTLDLVGAGLMLAATVSLLLALTWGGSAFPWDSAEIAGLFAASVLGWILFSLRLAKAREPFIPLSVLANSVVRNGVIAMFFAIGSLVGLSVFMPLYFEAVLGLTAATSGVALIALMGGAVTGATISGRVMVHFTRYKLTAVLGLAIAALATLALAIWPGDLSFVAVEVILAVIGVGLGTIFPVGTTSIQNAVPLRQLGTATGVMNFFRSLGGAILVPAFSAIFLASVAAGGDLASVQTVVLEGTRNGVDFAHVFTGVFVAAAIALALAFVFQALMKELPLRTQLDLIEESR